VFIGIIGLMVFVPLLRELLRSSLDASAVLVILIAYLLTVFLMFAVLVGHVWKNSGEARVKGNKSSDGFADPGSFRSVNTAQLTEPTFQPASVTEHTTKTLDKVPISNR